MLMNSRTAFLILAFCAFTAQAERVKITPIVPRTVNKAFTTKVTDTTHNTDSLRGGAKPVDAAVAFAKSKFNLKEGDYRISSQYTDTSSGLTHVYLRQVLHGIDISNADMNINVNKQGKVLSFGSSFLPLSSQVLAKSRTWNGSSGTKFVKPADAFKVLAKHIGKDAPNVKEVPTSSLKKPASSGSKPTYELTGVPFADGNVRVEQAYVQTKDGVLVPAWRNEVKMSDNWLNVHVNADGSKVERLIDWTADASYRVIKFGESDPESTQFSLVSNPQITTSSPKGWHDQNGPTFTTTIGNNVYAQENWAGADDYLNNKRPDGGKSLKFDFKMDPTQDPKSYYEASVTHLFYINNMMHDLSYAYGFDEVAGNFQKSNLGKGGEENDFVIANAQDGSGTDNANFATPPDGQNGVMRMYIFDTTTPNRDGVFSNDIPSHEFTHGISTRLTGGPANSDCLADGEPGGMGEGWSDFMAISVQIKPSDTRSKNTKVGAYVFNGKTIRNYEYSTDMTTNPTTYGLLNDPNWQEVHAIGEIWCNILYEMLWNLVDATGKINGNVFSVDTKSGNTLAIKLVIDAMKLQPCNPTFVTARDAIIQADENLTGGTYKCEIWKAFAKRGVGQGAASNDDGSVTEDTALPSDCSSDE